MSDIYNMKPRKGEKFHFVDFTFSFPARGMTEQEVIEYAVEQFVDASYDITKGMRRYPESYTTISEKIDAPEDYFYWEEE